MLEQMGNWLFIVAIKLAEYKTLQRTNTFLSNTTATLLMISVNMRNTKEGTHLRLFV